MKAIPKTVGMQEGTNSELRLRVLARDSSHDPAPNLLGKSVQCASDHLESYWLRHCGQIGEAEGHEVERFRRHILPRYIVVEQNAWNVYIWLQSRVLRERARRRADGYVRVLNAKIAILTLEGHQRAMGYCPNGQNP